MSYHRSKKNKTYIIKPDNSCQGKGIMLTKTPKVSSNQLWLLTLSGHYVDIVSCMEIVWKFYGHYVDIVWTLCGHCMGMMLKLCDLRSQWVTFTCSAHTTFTVFKPHQYKLLQSLLFYNFIFQIIILKNSCNQI